MNYCINVCLRLLVHIIQIIFYQTSLRTNSPIGLTVCCFDQVFALISSTYQALSQFAKLPSVTSSAADLPDSQLISAYGNLLHSSHFAHVTSESLNWLNHVQFAGSLMFWFCQ